MRNENPKNKILILAVTILLLANIAMLAFILFHQERGKKGFHNGKEAMMNEFLQKEIGFDQAQMLRFDTLSKKHHEEIKTIFEEAGKNKENQVRQLAAANFSDSAIDIIARQSSEKQKAVEVSMFRHLRQIRDVCSPAQQPRFDSLVYRVMGRRGEGRKKKGDDARGF